MMTAATLRPCHVAVKFLSAKTKWLTLILFFAENPVLFDCFGIKMCFDLIFIVACIESLSLRCVVI